MKLKTLSRFYLIVIASLLFGCGKDKGEAIDLKLKLEAGQVERVYAATVTKGGPLEYQGIIEMRFTIDSVKTDRNFIDVKVVRISSDTDEFGKKESYDSNRNIEQMSEEEKSMHLGFRDVLNKSFSVSIDNKGKVIEPFKSKETGRGKLTEEIIDISNIYIPFPDEPVYMDSEWKAERTDATTSIKTVSTYKITGINEKEIMVSITSEIEGIKGFLAKNTAKGQYVLDKKTCKLISGDFSMSLEDKRKVFFKFRSIPNL